MGINSHGPRRATIVAFANIAGAMPLADIIAAANDPSNMGKVAQVVQDIIAAAPLPPLTGEVIDLGIAGFVALVTPRAAEQSSPTPTLSTTRRQHRRRIAEGMHEGPRAFSALAPTPGAAAGANPCRQLILPTTNSPH